MWVVVYGNPFEGMRIVGPFKRYSDAEEYADVENPADDWWITELQEPEE